MLRAPGSPANKWLTLFATCVGLGMLMIDTFIVNVAFPAIGRDLDASLSATEWTVSGYVLMTGVLPIAMGRMGDIFGRRRIYLAGLVGFIITSALCGLAQNIEQLIVLRIFQGAAAATMMPLTLSIITNAFPPEQRGLAIGIWGGVSGLGLIAGPILGGLLVNGDEWRWIFLVNIPVGAVALALAVLWIPESRDTSASRSLDWRGLATLSGGLGLLLFGLNRANDLGWGSAVILACFAGGFATIALFVVVERRVRAPLVDLSLFKSLPFVTACISAWLFSATVFGSQPYTSLFMQNYMGFSPLEGGLAFLPATGLVAALMPVSGILGQKLGHRIRLIIIAGSLSVGVSFLWLLRMDVDATYVGNFLPAFLLRGLGIGLVMSATSFAVVSAMPVAKSGLASGTLTMARNIGTSMGVAIFGAVFLQSMDARLPDALAEAGVPAVEAAAIEEEASHFIPAESGAGREASRDAIVDSFIVISIAGLAIAALAATSAAMIRPKRVAPVVATQAQVTVAPAGAD